MSRDPLLTFLIRLLIALASIDTSWRVPSIAPLVHVLLGGVHLVGDCELSQCLLISCGRHLGLSYIESLVHVDRHVPVYLQALGQFLPW